MKYSSSIARYLRGWLATGLLLASGLAQAQFAVLPAPSLAAPPAESAAKSDTDYRVDAAHHIYNQYPKRIYRGMLPPLIFSVMMVDVTVDSTGQVADVSVVRKPAADEVAPWVIAMIKRAAPFPAPVNTASGAAHFSEVWFVDKSGLFQLMSLTEGQR